MELDLKVMKWLAGQLNLSSMLNCMIRLTEILQSFLGERQRVAIARALANNPSIILADEPTGSLDSKNGQMILQRLKELHEKENVTLIMVTHDLNVASEAQRTIKVLDGKVQN